MIEPNPFRCETCNDSHMNKKTGIPEFLAGVLSLIFFFWLFPTLVDIHQSVYMIVDSSKIENIPLIMMAAFGVLIFGIYGVLGVYFFTRCMEILYYRFKKEKP
jgi:H+/Cl- antiporter ClcA